MNDQICNMVYKKVEKHFRSDITRINKPDSGMWGSFPTLLVQMVKPEYHRLLVLTHFTLLNI